MGKVCMVREQDLPMPSLPLPQGLPLELMQSQEEAGSCQLEKGKGLAMPSLVAWSRGAVPSGSAYLYR